MAVEKRRRNSVEGPEKVVINKKAVNNWNIDEIGIDLDEIVVKNDID